jgi:hypothetical protein
MEVFMDNLPGLPDNIRLSSSGGYWIGMATLRSKVYDYMAENPWLKKMVTKVIIKRICNQHHPLLKYSEDHIFFQ